MELDKTFLQSSQLYQKPLQLQGTRIKVSEVLVLCCKQNRLRIRQVVLGLEIRAALFITAFPGLTIDHTILNRKKLRKGHGNYCCNCARVNQPQPAPGLGPPSPRGSLPIQLFFFALCLFWKTKSRWEMRSKFFHPSQKQWIVLQLLTIINAGLGFCLHVFCARFCCRCETILKFKVSDHAD